MLANLTQHDQSGRRTRLYAAAERNAVKNRPALHEIFGGEFHSGCEIAESCLLRSLELMEQDFETQFSDQEQHVVTPVVTTSEGILLLTRFAAA